MPVEVTPVVRVLVVPVMAPLLERALVIPVVVVVVTPLLERVLVPVMAPLLELVLVIPVVVEPLL